MSDQGSFRSFHRRPIKHNRRLKLKRGRISSEGASQPKGVGSTLPKIRFYAFWGHNNSNNNNNNNNNNNYNNNNNDNDLLIDPLGGSFLLNY